MDGHISRMAKPSNRDKILTEGLRVVHAHGFAGSGVRDIVRAAGVPQGSFTNHFASKEAFGLEIIDLYLARGRETMQATLLDDTQAPLARLAAYIDFQKDRQSQNGMRNGCLFGNFAAEASESCDSIRLRLVDVFGEVQTAMTYCLRAAVKAGELPEGFDCEETAGFIVSSLQGANLLCKTQRSSAPIDRFKKMLFDKVLR